MDGRTLSFGDMEVKPDVRKLGELSGVLLQPDSIAGVEDEPAYFMYRDLGKNEVDRKKIREAGLRYDITVIPPRRLGIEYVKTLGHFHPPVSGTDVAYPELYQVLSGRAHYLLQKMGDGGLVDDVVVVEAHEGEMLLIPPGYGHVTINPKGVELSMANWVCNGFESKYDLIKEMKGAAYYEAVEDNWIANKNYSRITPPRRRRTAEPSLFGLGEREDAYKLVEDLSKLDPLVNPQNHVDFFRGLP